MILIGPLGINFSEILIETGAFSFKDMPLNISSAKWRPCCSGKEELIPDKFATDGVKGHKVSQAKAFKLSLFLKCAVTLLIHSQPSMDGCTVEVLKWMPFPSTVLRMWFRMHVMINPFNKIGYKGSMWSQLLRFLWLIMFNIICHIVMYLSYVVSTAGFFCFGLY